MHVPISNPLGDLTGTFPLEGSSTTSNCRAEAYGDGQREEAIGQLIKDLSGDDDVVTQETFVWAHSAPHPLPMDYLPSLRELAPAVKKRV
ncbi:hypothetical protein LA080_014741 [Diaporthe eres]|nr:hypothetical protein LA080_014741 [Diaporthe eres]